MQRLLIALVNIVSGISFASHGRTTLPTAIDKPRTELRPATWLSSCEAVLLGAAVSLTVFALQWRYGFLWSDEGWLWYIGQRTALCQVPLRDFFSYDPGRYYWSAVFFKLTGSSGLYQQILADYLFAIIGLAVAYFFMIRAGLGRSWRIAILLLLGVVIGFPRHKIYEQILSLMCVSAIAFVFEAPQRLMRWFLLGVGMGLAAFFGRNSGIFFALAVITALLLLSLRANDLHFLVRSAFWVAAYWSVTRRCFLCSSQLQVLAQHFFALFC
jgi:hypothetical protein